MTQNIKTIKIRLPFKLGSVNCYLVEIDTGFVLIDTGSSNMRDELERVLENAGCQPGNLKLILITHGDFDHTGNAAYLRQTYGAKIEMHSDDVEMVEKGDMFSNRKRPNILVQKIVPILFGFGRNERFKPDILIDNEYELSQHGINAKVISIPGHSKGSIRILMENGELFCGDLLENLDVPQLNSIIDDIAAAKESVEILNRYEIKTIYPGHGEPFTLEQLKEQIENKKN